MDHSKVAIKICDMVANAKEKNISPVEELLDNYHYDYDDAVDEDYCTTLNQKEYRAFYRLASEIEEEVLDRSQWEKYAPMLNKPIEKGEVFPVWLHKWYFEKPVFNEDLQPITKYDKYRVTPFEDGCVDFIKAVKYDADGNVFIEGVESGPNECFQYIKPNLYGPIKDDMRKVEEDTILSPREYVKKHKLDILSNYDWDDEDYIKAMCKDLVKRVEALYG
jgi:hypothetical protein